MSGTNNPPVTTPDTASVTEDETLVTTGNVLANDTDPDGLPLSVTAVNGIAVNGSVTIVGTYGTLIVQPDGQFAYTLADSQANVRSLANGEVVPDTFTYTVSDGNTYTQTTTETVQNLIPQSEAFDDPTWVQFSRGHLPGGDAECRSRPERRRQHGRRSHTDKPRLRPLLPDQRGGHIYLQRLGAIDQR